MKEPGLLTVPVLLHALIHRSAWKGYSTNFGLTEFSEVCLDTKFSEPRSEGLEEASTTLAVAARIPALVGSTRGERHRVTHGSLRRLGGRWGLPPLARRVRVGASPRASPIAPAPQRRCRFHLRGFGRDLRRAPGARGHLRVGGIPGRKRDGRAGGQRDGRDLLAWLRAARARGRPPPGARPILRRGGGP